MAERGFAQVTGGKAVQTQTRNPSRRHQTSGASVRRSTEQDDVRTPPSTRPTTFKTWVVRGPASSKRTTEESQGLWRAGTTPLDLSTWGVELEIIVVTPRSKACVEIEISKKDPTLACVTLRMRAPFPSSPLLLLDTGTFDLLSERERRRDPRRCLTQAQVRRPRPRPSDLLAASGSSPPLTCVRFTGVRSCSPGDSAESQMDK